MEEWRSVTGYEGLYEASDLGRVRNSRTGRILKLNKTKFGYYQVQLCKDGKKKMFRVNRLVWSAFNGVIPEGMVIDHEDAVKTNNCLSNLRCVTPKENNWNPVTRPRLIHAMRKRSQSPEWRKNMTDATRKANSKSIIQIDKQTGETIKRFECAMDAWRELGINQSSISLCCNGKLKSSGGYYWRFA